MSYCAILFLYNEKSIDFLDKLKICTCCEDENNCNKEKYIIKLNTDHDKYKQWIKSEFSRLKDFLAASVKPNVDYAHVLQDGGELRDGILEDLGPEVWEDFQTNFIDVSI